MSAAPTASEALLRKKLATRHRPKGFMEAILAEADPRRTGQVPYDFFVGMVRTQGLSVQRQMLVSATVECISNIL